MRYIMGQKPTTGTLHELSLDKSASESADVILKQADHGPVSLSSSAREEAVMPSKVSSCADLLHINGGIVNTASRRGDVTRLRRACKATVAIIRLIGARRVWRKVFPGQRCFFDVATHPGVRGYVAFTIDDGFCGGGGRERLLLDDVLNTLAAHDARATFFTITNYSKGLRDEVERLLAAGHELGNHMPDAARYHRLDEAKFEAALLEARDVIADLTGGAPPTPWFRAPEGKYSQAMAKTLTKHNMQNIMWDCFALDMCVPEPEWVANTLLRDARDGSIVLMHMPERGFREWQLEAIALTLAGLRARGLKPVTLTELHARANDVQVQVRLA